MGDRTNCKMDTVFEIHFNGKVFWILEEFRDSVEAYLKVCEDVSTK